MDESSLILIKSVESTTTPETLHELAETIVAMMNAEALLDVKVAYGTVVTGIEGRIQVLQGSQDGTGCNGKIFLRREKR